MMKRDVPVYLITGFLESSKTQFLDFDSLTNLMEITIPHTLNITKYQILLLAHNKFSQLSVFALIVTKSFL